MRRKRIYEYEDGYGRVLWSFHDIQPPISFGHTLTQLSKLGKVPSSYLAELQRSIADDEYEYRKRKDPDPMLPRSRVFQKALKRASKDGKFRRNLISRLAAYLQEVE